MSDSDELDPPAPLRSSPGITFTDRSPARRDLSGDPPPPSLTQIRSYIAEQQGIIARQSERLARIVAREKRLEERYEGIIARQSERLARIVAREKRLKERYESTDNVLKWHQTVNLPKFEQLKKDYDLLKWENSNLVAVKEQRNSVTKDFTLFKNFVIETYQEERKVMMAKFKKYKELKKGGYTVKYEVYDGKWLYRQMVETSSGKRVKLKKNQADI